MSGRPLRSTLFTLAALAATSAFANAAREFSPESPANQLVKEVDIVESLNEQVPLDAEFTGTDGKKVTLKQLIRGDKPVVLTLVYYKCPMLCPLVLGALTKSARNSGMALGEDYRAITISIDPRETPADASERQRGHLQALGTPGQEADWPFLVGDETNIHKVADAVGFKYRFDQASQQYAHAAAIVVLTPEGRVSRYLYGVEFPPRDLKLALLEAAGGRVGTSFDRIIMQCFKYDPNTRRYEFYIFGFIRAGALLVFGALAATLAVFWRREYKRGSIK
ncbi:MAG: SCO family protein [Myxococcaceae bacterium]|nr:SCO family protein [Myxococcaceae bacterium]